MRERTTMEPPPGFVETAVRRALAEIGARPIDDDSTLETTGERRDSPGERRDSGFFELEDGPPTLPFVRSG